MDPVLLEGIRASLVGILVVFCALGLITALLMSFELGRPYLERLERALEGEHGPSGGSPKRKEPSEGEVPTEVLVAICAAAIEVLGPSVRIRRVRYVTRRPAAGWAMQGRVSIMSSRVTRR